MKERVEERADENVPDSFHEAFGDSCYPLERPEKIKIEREEVKLTMIPLCSGGMKELDIVRAVGICGEPSPRFS